MPAGHSPSPCERPLDLPRGLRCPRPYGHRRLRVNGKLRPTVDKPGDRVGTTRGVAVEKSGSPLWTASAGSAPRRGDLQQRFPPAVYTNKLDRPGRVTVGVVSEQESLFPATSQPAVEVVRSTRRRRTVSAHRAGDRIIVSVPARISRAEEQHWVALMVARILASEQRARPGDDDLLERATVLSRRYLDGIAEPTSVRWVDNMTARWGSCTPVDGTIRLSRRLVGMPGYVLDYVLLHELAHLIVPGHGRDFWQLLAGYERLERARGFLEGVGATPKP
jgi:predicted metal-dependent hydrolase